MPREKSNVPSVSTRYVTTAIPYVNAKPHVGFALEVVQADALARCYRQFGDDVRFLSGTDENSSKNVQAAYAAGVPVAELVARNAASFLELQDALDLSYDDFIRTSTDPRHRRCVELLWNRCFRNGDIYKRRYSGLYCTGCEQFYKPGELIDGKCPEHQVELQRVEEENWFFRLSRYQSALGKMHEDGVIQVLPASRASEIRSWIDAGLEDFSISRNAERSRGWGVPVPGDETQVIYVWFDALANYLSALGYGGSADGDVERWWFRSVSREHVIGKGITRFHGIYWPAMLLSAGLPLPTRVLVHGYVTVHGRKIGKSAGNAVDPVPLTRELGADALRYYLLRHIRGDGDFSEERYRQAYDSELADQLGNLVNRVLSMIERYRGGIVPEPSAGPDLLAQAAADLPAVVRRHIENFSFDRALDEIWAFVAACNRHVSESAPWELAKAANGNEPAKVLQSNRKLDRVLSSLASGLLTLASCLQPLLPQTSAKILHKLGRSGAQGRDRVEVGLPLFPGRRRSGKQMTAESSDANH